ncbi:MAG: VCBS repeat-containing protein, partial [Balneolaceae bacterium]|nr:VCBS repeat-containing protein [Balneolaceae bacterium]
MPKTKLLHLIITFLIWLSVSACGEKSAKLDDNTQEMVAMMDSIAQNVNPKLNYYDSAARLDFYNTVPQPIQTDQRVSYQYSLAFELLKAGETEEAIERFKKLLEFLDELEADQNFDVASIKQSARENLALSYLRLGEQQNCIINHSSVSCLFPIKGEGIHTLTEGSENAIQLYEEILSEKDSVDMISRWLLNIAYMTLGRHPQDVPEQWLIPTPDVESQYDIGTFHDIAPMIGLAEEGLSGGSVTEDFNHDGFIDVMASSWGLDDQIHYFENSGDGTFIKKTDEAGLTGITGGLNLRHADFNNDGFADVLVLRGAWLQEGGHHPNSLLRNNGDGTFSDVTKSAGLLSFHPTQTAEWGDFNNDGWLDLFIGNESTEYEVHRSELYLNQKDGTFENIAEQAGVNVIGYIKGVANGDFNNDGLQDLYISRLDGLNQLFKNNGPDENGIPVFTDVTFKAGVQEPFVSFPTWFWDYNNDGWLDLFVSAYQATPGDIAKEYLGKETDAEMPRLYRNNGDGTFTNVTAEAGLNKVMYTMGSNYG